jgi:hypothetical protein
MNQEDFSWSTVDSIPTADMQIMPSAHGFMMNQTYPVKQPERDKRDFIIPVRASVLDRCRCRLEEIRNPRFTWGELLLGIATSCAGAIAGALTTDIKLDSLKGIGFYVVLPMVAVGTFVAYLFCRTHSFGKAADIAREVLTEIPDPDKTT